ncbi:MAG: tail fiber domain-containing protein [Bacteroidales bacterium]|nr:tail fiber domain-containing protein [Bacteroidales bacterium]
MNIGSIDICRLIKEKLAERGLPVAWLARNIGRKEDSLRKTLNHNRDIYTDRLFHISVALKEDFFACYSERLKKIVPFYCNKSHTAMETEDKGVLQTSDSSFKTNITPMRGSLQKVKNLQGVRFQYKDREDDGDDDFRLGFITQEVEQVFPEVVKEMHDGIKAMFYTDLIAVLVEAIKEQQLQIDNLQEQIDACCQHSPAYSPPKNPDESSEQEEIQDESPLKNTSVGGNNILDVATAKLFQNTPNPFSANTEIRFDIPQNTTSAKLLIHDMQGGEINAYTISQRGLGSIVINGFELSAGMYMYTLLVNNTIIDTKKMILTK